MSHWQRTPCPLQGRWEIFDYTILTWLSKGLPLFVMKRKYCRFAEFFWFVQQLFLAWEAWEILTDVTQNYSLVWYIHCFLKLSPNDPYITRVTVCFHELGFNDEGLNISLNAGRMGKKSHTLIKITMLLLPMLIHFLVFLVGQSECYEPPGSCWRKWFDNLL